MIKYLCKLFLIVNYAKRASDVHGAMLGPKKIFTRVQVIPAPFRVPTQRLLVPSFT